MKEKNITIYGNSLEKWGPRQEYASPPPKRLSIQLAEKVYKKLNIIIIWFNNSPVDIYRKYRKRESNKSCHHFLRPKGRNNLSVYKSADEGLHEMQSIQTLKHSPDVERNTILTRATTQDTRH